MALWTHASRVLANVANDTEIQDPDFVENLRIYLNLPKMVPEIILPDCVTRQHFLQWDPRVFCPGSIWRTVSFLGKITDYEHFLFVAVVFSVDKRMQEGEPRVWKELSAAWDAAFNLAPGERRPNVAERRYGSLTVFDTALEWSGYALLFALDGESCNLSREEHSWLKDCLYRYDGMIDSLEKLRYVRGRMLTEGPRWWRASGPVTVGGELHWMPKRFWGANGEDDCY